MTSGNDKLSEYRARAKEAAECAARAGDAQMRKSWELVAKGYHDMAEQLARKLGSGGPRR
jgi:hypothetical protein